MQIIKERLFVTVAILFGACASTGSVNEGVSTPVSDFQAQESEVIDVFQVLTAGAGDAASVRQALQSDSPDIRMAGLFALGQLGSTVYLLFDDVLALADDPDAKMRYAVTSLLPAFATTQTLHRIIVTVERLTSDRVAAVRIAALNAARRLGKDALPLMKAIRRAATDPTVEVKAAAVAVSCVIASNAHRPDLALPIAMATIDDRKQPVRVAAVRGIGQLRQGGMIAFDKLLMAADDPSAEVRAAAMAALPKVDPPRAWSRCLVGIDDPDLRVVGVAGACLKGVRGATVGELISRFQEGNVGVERAMAVLLAGAHPSAAAALARAAKGSDMESRARLAYSLWHLSRRSGHMAGTSRWEEQGDWGHPNALATLSELVVFTSNPRNLRTAQAACQDRWGGELMPVENEDELSCFGHHLGLTEVGIRTVVTDILPNKRKGHRNLEPGSDLKVEYQAIFALHASDELSLQVTVLQQLEDAGCHYIPDRLPEVAACKGRGGKVEVHLVPGRGVIIVKPLYQSL